MTIIIRIIYPIVVVIFDFVQTLKDVLLKVDSRSALRQSLDPVTGQKFALSFLLRFTVYQYYNAYYHTCLLTSLPRINFKGEYFSVILYGSC